MFATSEDGARNLFHNTDDFDLEKLGSERASEMAMVEEANSGMATAR